MDAKILIVEDDAILRSYYAIIYKKRVLRQITYGTVQDALHHAVEKTPDLILLDLMLPEVDGTIVCRLLKNDPRTKNIPIVMVTAKDEEKDRVAGLELGADDISQSL